MVAALVACIVSVASADVLLVEGSEVRRYSDEGTFLGTFAAGLNTPLSVVPSETSGDFFVSQHVTGEIRKYDGEGMDLGPVLAGFADWQPAGLAWNDGRLYAASVHHKALASYVPDAGAEDGNASTPEPQCVLEGLAEAPNGLCSAGTRGGVYFTTSDEVSATALLRRTVELWINDGVSPEGQVYYVWRGGSPADSNPAVLIGAWAYVEASGDLEWFRRNAERLEFISRYLENRDVDGDGLVESPQSGSRDSHSHGETAWDCISSGHKNAYVNALAYRAWRGLARLQERAGRTEPASHFSDLAARLKTAYRDTFYNAETGWLGWWRSADGELHDLWSDMPTSMAIMYGLVSPEEGRPMLDRYWTALEKTGFSNFELGLPLNLRPIPPALMLTGFGGKLEDGSDNYGKWLNGGLCLSNTSFWLAASLTVGQGERADRVLNAMLARQARSVFPNGGSFQNGIVDNPPNGAECFDWHGNPCGYEGHLVYSWTWMQALLLRDAETRQRVFGVLH